MTRTATLRHHMCMIHLQSLSFHMTRPVLVDRVVDITNCLNFIENLLPFGPAYVSVILILQPVPWTQVKPHLQKQPGIVIPPLNRCAPGRRKSRPCGNRAPYIGAANPSSLEDTKHNEVTGEYRRPGVGRPCLAGDRKQSGFTAGYRPLQVSAEADPLAFAKHRFLCFLPG